MGQEIVEVRSGSRGQVRGNFTGFEIEGPVASIWWPTRGTGKTLARSQPLSPLSLMANGKMALGYIRREVATPGKRVEAGRRAALLANFAFLRKYSSSRRRNDIF